MQPNIKEYHMNAPIKLPETYVQAYHDWLIAYQIYKQRSAVWPFDSDNELPTLPMSDEAMIGRALMTDLDAAIEQANKTGSPHLAILCALRDKADLSKTPLEENELGR
jgi:hypothetical protein